MEDRKKSTYYIAAVLFLLQAALVIINCVEVLTEYGSNGLNIWVILNILGLALTAAALFTQSDRLLAIGACIQIVWILSCFFDAVGRFIDYLDPSYANASIQKILYLTHCIRYLLAIASWGFILLSVFKKDKAVTYCIVSAALMALSCILYMIAWTYLFAWTSGFLDDIVSTAISCISVLLIGFSLQGIEIPIHNN